MPHAPPVHKPQRSKAPRHMQPGNRQTKRAFHTGSKAWRLMRAQVLTEELYVCRHCGGFADQVDHIDGNDSNNARENLQALCISCHSRKTRNEQNEAENGRKSV